MQPITKETEVQHGRSLIRDMMLQSSAHGYEFDAKWVQGRGWKVVPVEDTCHFAPIEITTIVRALRLAGIDEIFAVASESVDPAPACYRLLVAEEEFRHFNSECGLLRFVLTCENRSWALSCNEWYNLFAGTPELLEALLGESIEEARQEFRDFAVLLAEGNAEAPLMLVADHYAAL